VVEDDASLREALSDILELAGCHVTAVDSGESALRSLASQGQIREDLRHGPVDLVVSDVQMAAMDGHALLREIKARWPSLPVVLMTAYGSIGQAVAAMRDGAADYLVKPFEAEVLIEMVGRLTSLPNPVAGVGTGNLVAVDSRTRDIAELACRVAGCDATVMISGESGTGKEVFARLIHDQSPRRDGPFVAINCAAIPETMLESTLFGYEKGAFTGAYQARAGKFEQAQHGTLLLDEISEMAISLQAKLLRVLQEREVERLGGRHAIPLDVRVLATTNRHLRDEVSAGRFREDLFYRLNVFPLQLPPLRERAEDIVPLAISFIAAYAPAGMRIRLAGDAELALRAHTWPGNIRELQNAIQRALILQTGGILRAADIRFEEIVSRGVPTSIDMGDEPLLGSDLRQREQELIIEALRMENGRRKDAAARLGISPRTLRYKLARIRGEGTVVPGGALV
jgi:two-component system response regulator FlrC